MPDKVLITKSKLDSLANAISEKSGEPLPLTLAEMEDAVEGIPSGGTTWETVYNGTKSPQDWGDDLYYIQIANFFVDNNPILNGDKYRVTWRNTAYECVAQEELDYFGAGDAYVIGNATLGGGTTGNNEPFFAEQWSNDLVFATTDNGGSFTLVIEKQVSGGGSTGLEYETGTYTPVSDISQPTISFTNTHTDPPAIIVVSNNRSTSSAPASDAVMMWTYFDKYKMFGGGFQYNSSSIGYSYEEYLYNSTGGSAGGSRAYTANNSSETGQGNTYPSYYTTNTAFTPIGSSSRKFISGETYKWVAVWAPST